MKNTISLLAFILLLSGCSANWHLKQAKRHERAAMIKGAEIKVDTIIKEIPVFIDRIALDTLLISGISDTVVIQKDRLRIKYVRLPGDTVWISGECDSLTIIKEIPVRIEKVIYAPDKGLKWWQLILIGVALGVILLWSFRK